MREEDYRDSAVRPFAVTRGRAAPSRNNIGVHTLLAAVPGAAPPLTATRPELAVLALCEGGSLSLAEVAVHCGQRVSVVVVLASDLVDRGLLRIASNPAAPAADLLQRVLDGLDQL